MSEQGGDRLLGRTIEERLHHLFQRRPSGAVTRHRGPEDVACALLVVPEVPLLFQNPQMRPHGGVARRVGQRG